MYQTIPTPASFAHLRRVSIVELHMCRIYKKKKINALYLSVKVFSTKVLIRENIFTSPTGDGTAILRGLAACSVKEVPWFLSYFKTLSIGPAPGIEPATSRSAVKRFTN